MVLSLSCWIICFFSFIVSFRSLPQVLCAVLAVQAFCQGAAFLSWRWLRDWARQAVWDRTWRWWSREYTPSLYLTFLPCQSLSREFRSGLPRPLLLQKKAEPGTVTLANRGPSSVLSVLLDTKYCEYCEKWIFFLSKVQASFEKKLNYFTFVNKLHAPLLGLRPCMLLLGGTFCVSAVRLLFTALQPTKCSHCLQPYGIVWQRTQTFPN